MKKQQLIFAIALLLLIGCSKENTTPPLVPEPVKSSEKQMLSFRFMGIDNNGITIDITAEIDEHSKAIDAIMPPGTEIMALEPEVEISKNAVYEPIGPQDFGKPINYTVTAEDGTSRTYLVTVDVALSQKEVLLKIAEANPGKFDWKHEDNLSDWPAVTINGQGQVVELNMFAVGLTVLPPEIGQLTSLQKLYLRENDLSTLPAEIGKLVVLQELNLINNNFEALPAEIGQLIALQRLQMDGNDLQALPPEIGQLSNLQFLRLPDNNLTEIPPEIGQLSNLQELILRRNSLFFLPTEISLLSKLQLLNLSDNQLSNLPGGIGGLSNLQHLDLDVNKLATLPPEIGQLQSLQSLELYSNSLSAIPSEIGQLINLEVLVINDNLLIEIPSQIGQLDNLKKLKLANNNLNVDDILPLFKDQFSTSCESGLEELDLRGNEGLKTLPGCICELDPLYGGTTDIDIVEEENSWAECQFVGTGKR